MIGALIGDISGSRFEAKNNKSKKFELFDKHCHPTDDSVMSLAIAKAILDCDGEYENLSKNAVKCMQELGRIYPKAGYGGTFVGWIFSENPEPYNSFGNGAAMRVGPCGFAAKSITEAKQLSRKVTEVTHNHPEGIKGAEAIAVGIFLAKNGTDMSFIKEYIQENYYKIDFTIDGLRDEYEFDVTCQGSVPVAFEAFFESKDFEDAIRNAISVGGDSDTIAAMTGSLAEAYYGISNEIIENAIEYLDAREMEILYYFEKKFKSNAIVEEEEDISIFEVLDFNVNKIIPEGTEVNIEGEEGDITRISVDPELLIPDFSSYGEKGYKQKKKHEKKEYSKKRKSLEGQLKDAIAEYNIIYSVLSDHGNKLFNQRERAIDTLDHVENLINSIANHPKEFDTDMEEIAVNKKSFKDVCDFAEKELNAARKSAAGVGAGVAGGVAVASLAPGAAMWVATTFGTASTGTAISTLSGAAATKAAMAWLGGGALAEGGGGIVAGEAFLALAGPVGWGIAGASILTSIIIFANKKMKIDNEKKKEITSILNNTEKLKETDAKVEGLMRKTDDMRNGLNKQYEKGLLCYNRNFLDLEEDEKTLLGTIVNNAKALSFSLKEGAE